MNQINDILNFWFGAGSDYLTVDPARNRFWFGKDAAVDQTVRERFGAAVDAALAGELDAWAGQPGGRMALVLLLDQFTRNMYRDTPEAFSGDEPALAITLETADEGADRQIPPLQRAFLYMPLQHAEDGSIQSLSVDTYAQLVDSVPEAHQPAYRHFLDFARRHKAVIDRFGRFPHRNRILGRPSSEAEQAFLQQPGSAF